MTNPTFRDNPEKSRFEMLIDDELVSHIDYTVDGDTYAFEHTITPEAHRGNGYANQITQWAADELADVGAKVKPVCPFTVTWFERHPSYASLLE